VDRLTRTPTRVTDLCVEYKLDSTKRSDRLKATRWGRKRALYRGRHRSVIGLTSPNMESWTSNDRDAEYDYLEYSSAEHAEHEDEEEVAGATEELGSNLLHFVTGKDRSAINDKAYSSMHEDLLQSNLFHALDTTPALSAQVQTASA